METLTIRIFGEMQLKSSETTVSSFPTRHSKELLVYLLLHPHIPHTRESLVDLLWPDIPLKKGRARLSTVLWQLRTLFERLSFSIDDFVQATRSTITFNSAVPFECDLMTFMNCMHQARRCGDDIEARKATLEAACDQYRGELGVGIYGEWCLVLREKYARQYLRAQAELMSIYMQQKSWPAAVEMGQSILSDDPLREEIHRALMQCYQKMEQYSLAIAQYQTLSDLLEAELSLWPMPETIELYSRVVNGRLQHLPTSLSHERTLNHAYREFQRAGQHLTTLLNQFG